MERRIDFRPLSCPYHDLLLPWILRYHDESPNRELRSKHDRPLDKYIMWMIKTFWVVPIFFVESCGGGLNCDFPLFVKPMVGDTLDENSRFWNQWGPHLHKVLPKVPGLLGWTSCAELRSTYKYIFEQLYKFYCTKIHDIWRVIRDITSLK